MDSKFGAAVETGQAMELVKLALTLSHLDLRGLHCHVGSQVFGEDVYQRTLDIMVPFLAAATASAIPLRTRPLTFPPVWRSWRPI